MPLWGIEVSLPVSKSRSDTGSSKRCFPVAISFHKFVSDVSSADARGPLELSVCIWTPKLTCHHSGLTRAFLPVDLDFIDFFLRQMKHFISLSNKQRRSPGPKRERQSANSLRCTTWYQTKPKKGKLIPKKCFPFVVIAESTRYCIHGMWCVLSLQTLQAVSTGSLPLQHRI